MVARLLVVQKSREFSMVITYIVEVIAARRCFQVLKASAGFSSLFPIAFVGTTKVTARPGMGSDGSAVLGGCLCAVTRGKSS